MCIIGAAAGRGSLVTRSLRELLDAYYEGDDSAREEVLARIERLLLPVVRSLMSSRLRVERDSMDVCQSLLLDFHARAESGSLDLETEKALGGYIRAMVRNKLANLSDRMGATRRGGNTKAVPLEGAALPAAPAWSSPSVLVYAAEIHQRIAEELSEEEWRILQGRLAGRTNREIAAELDKSPDAVRMVWNRTRERLIREGWLEK